MSNSYEMESERLKDALEDDLTAFVEKVFTTINPGTPYRDNWHIGVMTTALQKVMRGDIRRLIINVPPRHLKSTVTTIAFPAWVLGHYPHKRIIAASYGSDLAIAHAQATRTVMQADWYKAVFPAVSLIGKLTQEELHTSQHGGRFATSVGGPITGFGGDIIIVDDPIKPGEAASEAERKKANDWFDSSVLTRLDDPQTGAIIIVMQRLHEDDLTGHLLAKGGWEHICIPAEASQDLFYDFAGRKIRFRAGNILNPKRISRDNLVELRRNMGSFAYSAQYLQEPVPADGNVFHWSWLRFFDLSEIDLAHTPYVFQAWDVATTASSRVDFSVCTTWAVFEEDACA
jgi:hypothetical protein